MRVWIRYGKLAAMTGGNPHLVLGCDITAFLHGLRKTPSRMAADEFRCMTCRAPRKPWGRLADLVLQGNKMGRLDALCESCGGPMSKGISLRNLPLLRTLIDIR